MNEYYVYCHTCPNGKRYIGITKQEPNKRWEHGERYCEQVFYRAIKKYGWDNIKHEIVAEKLTKQDACKLEQKLIKKYKSNQKEYGYNKSIGGDEGRNSNYMSMKAKIFLRSLQRNTESVPPEALKKFKEIADYMCEDYKEAQVFNSAYVMLEKYTDKHLYERKAAIFYGLMEYIKAFYNNWTPECALHNALYIIYNSGQVIHDFIFENKKDWEKKEKIKCNEQLTLF